jgi:hypothetical protein
MTAERTAIVRMRVTDAEPFRSFIDSVSTACQHFAWLDDADSAALPEDVRAGIAVLCQAVAEFTGKTPPRPRREPEPYRVYGDIILEWPAPASDPGHPMLGWRVAVYDAATGKMMKTVTRADITVHADVAEFVTADLVMLADEQGEPVPDGTPAVKDGEILTGVFTYLVAAMRVRAPESPALPAAPGSPR